MDQKKVNIFPLICWNPRDPEMNNWMKKKQNKKNYRSVSGDMGNERKKNGKLLSLSWTFDGEVCNMKKIFIQTNQKDRLIFFLLYKMVQKQKIK